MRGRRFKNKNGGHAGTLARPPKDKKYHLYSHFCFLKNDYISMKDFLIKLLENSIKVICFAFGIALKIGILAAAIYIALKLIF